MLKILVFSDSHRNCDRMIKITNEQKPALLLHLGDNVSDALHLSSLFPAIPLKYVCGNGDLGTGAQVHEEFELCGKRFFMTHGHNYGVKFGPERLESIAAERGADIALFGHTHMSFEHKRAGLPRLFNPGSISLPNGENPSFGIINIVDSSIICAVGHTN